ncbi:MAG: putative Zn finger-like uncharacterized protein [Myxococcota bacterium]|jgi:predicted Zn finger-like uncharacterized protein
MIAACPKCTARYRVDESRIGVDGARLRCAKCEAVFRVMRPVAAVDKPAAPVVVATRPVPALTPPAPQMEAPPQPQTQPAPVPQEMNHAPESMPVSNQGGVVDRDLLVVVADPDVESGKATVSQLSAWGLQPVLVHDGVEAMLTIQRMLPRVVILDAGLPKMYGFQVCEVIKRNESLRHTGVILVGAVHNQDRYRRQPAELYGADHYIEQPDLPEGLVPLFEQMGVDLPTSGQKKTPAPPPLPEVSESAAVPRPVPVAPAPAPQNSPEFDVAVEPPVVTPRQVVAPMTPTAPAPGDTMMEERANAERLARIIVSDISLYHPEKFAAAIAQGSPAEAMSKEIDEGRVLFAQRIDESIRAERDFIVEEMHRVAKQRAAQ